MNIIGQAIKLTNAKFDKPYDKLSDEEKTKKASIFLQNYIKLMKESNK